MEVKYSLEIKNKEVVYGDMSDVLRALGAYTGSEFNSLKSAASFCDTVNFSYQNYYKIREWR